MELVSPHATTTPMTPTQGIDADAPEQPDLRLSVARTAALGLLGSSAIVVGAVLGGQSFETHLPGAWFFGMPGGTFGSLGSSSPLPTDRVPGARVRRIDRPQPRVVRILAPPERPPRLPGEAGRARGDDLGDTAAPRATTLQSRRLYVLGTGRDGEPPHQPVLLRARGARGDAVQPIGRHHVVGRRIALRPHLLECGRPARPGFRPPNPARPRPAPAAGGRGSRHGRGRHPDACPCPQTRPGPCRPDRGGLTAGAVVADRGCSQRRA